MVDSLRSGGFGSPFLGYGDRQGGFSQYRIGNDSGEDLAYLDKLAAQTAWQNGQISDDAYLAALAEYVKATDKDSSSRISAENQLRDAEYNIGRNELVVKINNSGSGAQSIAAMTRLIAYERRWRAGMTSDNEQYREITDSINGLQQQVRSARWGEIVRKYNNDQLSDARMQAYARQMAQQASGAPDEQTYRDYITSFGNAILDDKINDAIDSWNKSHSAGDAKAVEGLYATRMAKMNKQSPAYEATQERLTEFREAVTQQKRTREYEVNRSRYEAGLMSDASWLDYMFKRVKQERPGSVERIRARDAALAASFDSADRNLNQQVADGSRDMSDLIDFYQSSLVIMDLDSGRAKELMAKIAELRASGLEALDISSSQGGSRAGIPTGSGHYVMAGGAGFEDGYLSQHDGSEFAKTNCGMTAAAMLAWDVSGGKVKVSGGDMRHYSGDRDGGTWTDDMVRAMYAVGLGAREFHGMSFSTFANRIDSGKPAILTGSNSMLPASLRNGYSGDHAVFVARTQTNKSGTWYYVMDPNARSAADGGSWWHESVVHAFGWEGSYSGSAVFAGKTGNATIDPSRRNVQYVPPPQSFDTDWSGQSTLGRGGGASRSEAGARQDWSKGKKVWRLAEEAGGLGKVESFLEVIDGIDGNMSPEQKAEIAEEGPEVGGSDLERTQRAARVLARNGNDPRLAVVEWYTGRSPTADVGEWSRQDRWYANAAARKLGLDKITPETNLQPGAPPDPTPGTVAPEEPTSDEIVSGLDPDLDGLARGLLERLGIPPSESNIKVLGAWITTESGDAVQGNNPLRLMTPGDEDLEGQYGKSEDGAALFDSIEDGLTATARLIPPEIVAALRSNDPETALRAIEQSGWSEDPMYASHITRTYNTLPGDTPVIARTGPRPFTAPTSLSQLARTHPDLEEMLDVDPTDPVQMEWFTQNMERAREAAMAGHETFDYVPPGMGLSDAIGVPISHQVAKDITRVNYDYTVMTLPATPEGYLQLENARTLHDSMVGEIDMDMARDYMKEASRFRDDALLAGDDPTAANIGLAMARYANVAMGQGPDEVPDIANAPAWMPKEDVAFLTNVIDTLHEDPLMKTIYDGTAVVTRQPTMSFAGTMVEGSYITGVTLPDADFFHSVDAKGVVTRHTRDNDPEMFAEVTEVHPVTGEVMPPIPRYQSMKYGGLARVVIDGKTSYQPVTEMDVPFIHLYDWSASGRTKELIEQAEQKRSDIDIVTSGSNWLADVVGSWGGLEVPPLGGAGESAAIDPGEWRAGPQPAAKPKQEDMLLKPAGVLTPDAASHPTVFKLEMFDRPSGEIVTWISLDRMTWIGWMGDRLGKGSVGFVAQNGATLRANTEDPGGPPILTIGNEPYDPNVHDIGKYLVPWGMGNAPLPAGARGTGGPDGNYIVRQLELRPESDAIGLAETNLSLTPIDRWRGGVISYTEAASQQRAMDPEGWEKQSRGAQKGIWNIGNIAAPISNRIRDPRNEMRSLVYPGGIALNGDTRASAATARVGAQRVLLDEQRERLAAARARAAEEERAAATRAAAPRPKVTPTPSPTTTPQPSPEPTVRGTTTTTTKPKASPIVWGGSTDTKKTGSTTTPAPYLHGQS